MRRAGGIEIHIVPGEEARQSFWPRLKPLFSRRGLGPELAVALASVAAAVAVAEALSAVLRLPNLSMIFLTAVLFCAVRFGTRAAVLASLASFAAYNFFFHPAGLHVHGRAATGTVRAPHFSCRRRAHRIADRAHSRPEGDGDQERRGHPVALRLLAQAFRRLQRRRRPLGGRGAFARDIRRPHCASGRRGGRTANSRRLAARRAPRRRRSRRRALGAAEKGARGLGNRHAAAHRLSVSTAARRARVDCGLRL